ncbi:hypothetical protein ALC60_09846, partial [Trachymyrmex zeteki]
SMEPSREHYYDISKRYLTLIGQWPYQKSKESLLFLILILDASVLVTQAARFFVCDDIHCIFETVPPHLLATIIPVKIFTFQFNSQKVRFIITFDILILNRLSIDWDILESKTERDIMRRYAENGRWYVLIYSYDSINSVLITVYVYISTISFTTTSLVPRILDVIVPLNTSRPIMMPYPAYYFVDENRYFHYIFLHMMICSTICLTGLVAHDCMFFTYIEHICGLFAIVRYRFEHVSLKHSNTEKSMIDCPDYVYYKNIVISIHVHRKALQFAKLLEDTFSVSFGVQILLVTICLSITLVQVAKLTQCNGNTRCILLTIPALLLMIMILVKLYTCHFNKSKIKILTDHLVSDWEKLKGAEEYEIMKTYAANARLLSLAYCFRTTNRKIADSVYAHRRALRFAELLENTFCVAFAVQIMIVTVTMSISLLQVREIKILYIAKFFVCDNAQCIYETLPPHMLTVMILVKIFTYQFNSQKIKDLTDRLFVDWDMLETVEEHNIMRKYAQNGRWYAMIYGSYVYVSTISFTTTSLVPRILDIIFPLNTSRPIMLAYPAYYFVDENQYFYYIFLHMLFTSSMCMTGLIAHDSMFFTYVEHICGLFAVVSFCTLLGRKQKLILKSSLIMLFCANTCRFRFEHVSHKRSNTEKSLIDCLDNEFVKLLEDTFSISFAVQLLIVTVGLSITLVQIKDLTDRLFLDWDMLETKEEHDIMRKYAEKGRWYALIYGCKFTQFLESTFTISFAVQLLIVTIGLSITLVQLSIQLHDLAEAMRYFIPVKEQRLLMFVMRKSIEASVLSAGKLYVFSLENFTTVKQLTRQAL